MELEKELLIEEFKVTRIRNTPYVLIAKDGSYKSRLTFDKETLRKYRIEPSLDLVGKTLVVTLKSRELKYGGGGFYMGNVDPDDLLIGGG